KRQRLIHILQTTAFPHVFTPRALYDGGRLLYASSVLTDAVVGNIPVFPFGRFPTSVFPSLLVVFSIVITRTIGKEINPMHVNKLLTRGEATPETSTATNLLQLLLCQASNLANPSIYRAYFIPEGKQPLDGMAVELWRGFFQAVRPSIQRLLVTVDITVAAMYASGSLIDIALAVLQTGDIRRLSLRQEHSEDFKKIEKHLKHRLISIKTGTHVKTVHRLVPAPVGDLEFIPSGGSVMTINEYYRRAHGITLRHPETIGVVISGKAAPSPIVIPLELCTMIAGQPYKKKLPPNATASAIAFSAVTPSQRLKIIAGDNNMLRSPVQDYGQSEFMAEAGMVVEPQALTLSAHLLNVPSLVYYRQRKVRPNDGSWNVMGNKFFKPGEMHRWATVNCTLSSSERTLQQLVRSARELGPKSTSCSFVYRLTAAPGMGKPIIADALMIRSKQTLDMIVVLLPKNAEEIRTRIKHLSHVCLGVRTQCLRESKFLRGNSQCVFLVLLNARLGGTNTHADSEIMSQLYNEPFMIMGADVAHPGPGVSRPSIAALVWSHDRHGAAYCAVTRVQPPRQELITDLKNLIITAIQMFGDKHNSAPTRVFFYRDGVSEGEFEKVRAREIKAFNEIPDGVAEIWSQRKTLREVKKPLLTFVVVGKRHHVSFFPLSPTAADTKTGNCRAGLVVQEGMESPRFQDFYLQSHTAIKGTSRPGHYTILQDENFEGNVLKIQNLSFALCHIYARATRSVSIPAPIYYADLACGRGKFHVDPKFDNDFAGLTENDHNEYFDLELWIKAYNAVHARMQNSMYFL
ncbi:Piwi domain-containing protein, partial [Mycena crocata]